MGGVEKSEAAWCCRFFNFMTADEGSSGLPDAFGL